MRFTSYDDINSLLDDLLKNIQKILGENLIGFYLTGSLSYDNFNPERSDIDLVVIVKQPLLQENLEQIKQLHLQIKEKYKKWAKRIECSYTPVEMFQEIFPPKLGRPYIGEGIFYTEAQYGNEWLINNYLLYKHGITLFGPDFKTLIRPIDIRDVQKACVKDLFKEWGPKINDPAWLQNSHYQSYLVLNLCRILYTVMCNDASSKKVSASWLKNEFIEWKNLIETAEKWKYGQKMKMQKETVKFIKFTINKVKEKQLI